MTCYVDDRYVKIYTIYVLTNIGGLLKNDTRYEITFRCFELETEYVQRLCFVRPSKRDSYVLF